MEEGREGVGKGGEIMAARLTSPGKTRIFFGSVKSFSFCTASSL